MNLGEEGGVPKNKNANNLIIRKLAFYIALPQGLEPLANDGHQKQNKQALFIDFQNYFATIC